MSPNENDADSQAQVVAAAHAAASWIRSRRAIWSSAPLETGLRSSPTPASPPVVTRQPPAATAVYDEPLIAPAAVAEEDEVPAEPGAPLSPWVARGAIAAAVVTAAVVGGPYVWRALPARPSTPEPVAAPVVAPARAAGPATGSLHVGSTPPGAQVRVDGKARGVTPLDLRDLTAGRHEVRLTSDAGSVTRSVVVSANATVTVDESIFSGFVAVYAPFDVIVSEQGRPLNADERHQIMLPPGTHDLRFENRTLVYETVKRITIEPGEVKALQLKPDPSPLTVTASEAAEVWLDGAKLGDTPLNAAPVPLGVHDIVVKRAAGGERRYTVTVGARPVILKVDF